jgi:hypothetical protein
LYPYFIQGVIVGRDSHITRNFNLVLSDTDQFFPQTVTVVYTAWHLLKEVEMHYPEYDPHTNA